MSLTVYWLGSLVFAVVWFLGTAAWTGVRQSNGKARGGRTWHDGDGSASGGRWGEGWMVLRVLSLGLVAALGWTVSLVAVVLAGLFWGVVRFVKRGYMARVRKAEKERDALKERAAVWAQLAQDPEQNEDTQRAARETAQALRAQAASVRIPDYVGQKRR